MKTICAAAAALAVSSVAMAGSPIIEQSFDFDLPLSPNSVMMEFDQFDDLGGLRTLKEVILTVDATMFVDATAENESVLDAPLFEFQFNGSMIFDLLTLGGADIGNASFGAALSATDGMAGSGPDFNDFGTLMLGLGDNDSINSGLAPFIGAGTVSGDLEASGGFSFTGTTDALLGVDNFHIVGKATLTYVYNEVPAPGTAALFGLAGLTATRRRR